MGRVAASKNPSFKEGDIIVGRPVPWATYTIIKKEVLDKSGFRKASAQDFFQQPLRCAMHVLVTQLRLQTNNDGAFSVSTA